MVTIIIPVYNQMKYLNRCIDSVIKQTHKDIEIILINDGSTDESGKLCDEYGKKDNRIKVIHKQNGGLSSARNAGLDIMRGSFVTFLDSDDYLAHDYIETSVSLFKDDIDISILDMKYISENENEEIITDQKIKIEYLSNEQAIGESLYQIKFSCCAPGKMYRSFLFDTIRFPVNKLSEDLAICHEVLDKANKIVYSNKIGYYYRQQEKSIMHIFNPRRMDALNWVNDIEEFCIKKYPDLISAAKCRTFNVAVHLLLDISPKKQSEVKFETILWQEIKRTRLTVMFDRKVRFREKAAAILSFGGTRLLRLIWNSKLAVRR